MTPRRTALCAALALCVFVAAAAFRPASAQFADIDPQTAAAQPDDSGAAATLLSADELHDVVAPVALYPDDLLAIVLPAATQPLQIVEAARFLEKQKTSPDLKPNENWDPAVLALLNYPEVITLMNDDLGWTQQLGNAVMDQQKDLMGAIQAVRSEATSAGYLQSNDKQTVVTEQQTIIIKSADPEVIYVPTYDPAPVVQNTYVNYPPPVYSTPYPYYYAPGAAFVTGMFVGAAFSYGFDWNNNDIDIDFDGGNNNINIGSGNTNIDRDKLQNKFNGDRNPKAKGQNGMKWSPQKARTKSSATRPAAAKPRPNSAGISKQLGSAGAGTKKMTPTTRPAAQTKRDANRGAQSLGANKAQRQQQFKQPQKPKSSQFQQRQQQQKFNNMQYKPKKSSFSSMPSQSRARQQSNRGTSSIGGVKAPNRSRARR